MSDYDTLYKAILSGNRDLAVTVTRQALDDGTDPEVIVSRYMIPAMDKVGQRFECNEYFVPELLIAARAMKAALDLVKPKLIEAGAEAAGTVAIGTVKGDLHDIGKNLVSAMLEGGGFDIIDLGVDVAPERFIEAVSSGKANIICMSALLTTTMPQMKQTIDALHEAGLRDRVKVLIGGAPVTQQYAEEIGADGFGENAAAAVNVARTLAGRD